MIKGKEKFDKCVSKNEKTLQIKELQNVTETVIRRWRLANVASDVGLLVYVV